MDRNIFQLCGEISECAHAVDSADEFRRDALLVMGKAIGFETAVFTLCKVPEMPTTVGVDESMLHSIRWCEAHLDHFQDELSPYEGRIRREGAAIDTEVFNARDRGKMRFYAEVVSKQKVRQTLVVAVTWRQSYLGRIRLQRHGPQEFHAADKRWALSLARTTALGLVALDAKMVNVPEGDFAHRQTCSTHSRALPLLTAREQEVAHRVAQGLTTPQIACVLGTSKYTVRNQIAGIFDKLRVASRSELASWVARQQGNA